MHSEQLCAGIWPCTVPQGVAFVVTFIQALIHAIPSAMVMFSSMMLAMCFDSLGVHRDLVQTRRQWMEISLMVGCFGSTICVPLLVTAAGVVLGLIWITGQVAEAQKQARRVARLSFPLIILSSCIVAACLTMTLVKRRWDFLPPVAWFLVMAACSMSLFSHAQLHSPPPPEETRGMLLAALLLFGSLYQIWITPVLSGVTYSYSNGPSRNVHSAVDPATDADSLAMHLSPAADPSIGPDPVMDPAADPEPPTSPAVLAVLDKVHTMACFVFGCVALACGILGAVVALEVFFSNKDRPDMKYLPLHARLNTIVMVGSGPVPVALDGLWFLLTPSLGLSSPRNCWSVLEQPLVCVLFLLGMLWINQELGKVWNRGEQVPVQNSEDTALLAGVSTDF